MVSKPEVWIFYKSANDLHGGTGLGGGNQAYSRLSTTHHAHGHITDCKLDSVVYVGVCVWVNMDLSCLGRTIYARQVLGAKTPIQFRHRWAVRNTQTIYTESEPPSRMPNSLMPSAKLRSAHLSFFMSLVWHGRGLIPGLPRPERTL